MDTSHLLKQLCLTLVVLVEMTLTQDFDGCTVRYGRRGCHHRMLQGVLVTCDGQGKEDKVPQNLPVDTVYLALANFKLDTLSRAEFDKFNKVECLTVVDSGINYIEPDAFTGMDALLELSLQNTQMRSDSLRFVNDDNFKAILLTVSGSPHVHHVNFLPTKNLLNLKSLHLHHNGIKEFKRDLFEELRNLESLDLSHNKLEYLDWEWLNDMPKLNQLHLSGNLFQTIPQSMYGVFFAVRKLRLAGNRFHCNCKLRWLAEFYSLSSDKDLDVDSVECLSPDPALMKDMRQADFICSKPSKPQISFVQVEHDNRYEFNCTSYGDPAPTLTLTLPDGRKVVTPPPDDLSKSKPVTPQILSEPGPVHCEADNSEGRSETTEGLPTTLELTAGATTQTLSLMTLMTSLICVLLR